MQIFVLVARPLVLKEQLLLLLQLIVIVHFGMTLSMLGKGYIVVSKCGLLQRLRHHEGVRHLILSSWCLLLYLMQRYFHLLLRGGCLEGCLLCLLLFIHLDCFRCLKMTLVDLNRANKILGPHRSFFVGEHVGSNLLFFLLLFRGVS